MKKITLFAVLFCFIKTFHLSAQVPSLSGSMPAYQALQLQFNADSISGFNETIVTQDLLAKGLGAKEYMPHLAFLKRQYIKNKYGLNVIPILPSVSSKKPGQAAINGTPCVNEGFESTAPGSYTTANAVTGWTISNHDYNNCITPSTVWQHGSPQFSLLATPLSNVPNIGTIPHSPLGGTVVAKLNDNLPDYRCTRLIQTFPVTASNNVFTYAFAGFWDDAGSGHSCCERPGFRVVVKNCAGAILSCSSESLTQGCSNSIETYSTTGAIIWTNWQVRNIDLTPYIGGCVSVEVSANDCAFGGHMGTAYFDAVCGYAQIQSQCACPLINPMSTVNFCLGGNAVLQANPGYTSYAFGTSSGTLTLPGPTNQYTITSPTPGSVYNATLTSQAGCQFIQSFTLAPTQVSVNAIGSSPSCSLGSSGSATIVGTGSGSGYNYLWTNSSNSVVSSSSVAPNLAPGIYSVQLSSPNSACGTAGATVQVGNNQTNVYSYTKPFCGTQAYFTAPSGSNYQWYSNNSIITGTTGTAPSLTVPAIATGHVYRLSYMSIQGCKDSLIYTMASSSPPVLNAVTKMACEGLNNGQGSFTLSPVQPHHSGHNSFVAVSTGTTPSFTTSLTGTSLLTFSAGPLPGGTYSIQAFDGSCFTSAPFTITTYSTTNLFSFATAGSPSLCHGQSLPATIVLTGTNTPGSFTYSWSPNQYLINNNNTSLNTVIAPVVSVGNSTVIEYTVVVTPTIVNCPSAKVLTVTMSYPQQPSIVPPGQFCNNDAPSSFMAQPSGGYFTANNNALHFTGLFTPSLATPGVHTFSYVNTLNNCSAYAISSYGILQSPTLSVSGNTVICTGGTTTLTASGSSSYLWQGLGTSSTVTVSPSNSTAFKVVGVLGTCADSSTVMILVTPYPAVALTGDMNICIGESAAITAGGAFSYSWSAGGSGNTKVHTPQITSTYTITGTNQPGNCSTVSVYTIQVFPPPLVSLTAPDTACSGEPLLLVAQGADSYLWNGVPDSASHLVTLSSSTMIILQGTSSEGCSSQLHHLIKVIDCTGLQELSANNEAIIFPNPTTGLLNLRLKAATQIILYDAAGRLVIDRQMNEGSHLMDLSALSDGLYMMIATQGPRSSQLRIIKQ